MLGHLSRDEWKTFKSYNHISSRYTKYESYLAKHFTSVIEEHLLPRSWSPNTITIIGHVPLLMVVLAAVWRVGFSYEQEMPCYVWWTAAMAVQWADWFDHMDGQRARRLKCCTPIGRLVDEAGDQIQYVWIAFLLGYMWKLPSNSCLWLLFSSGAVVVMYVEEIEYILFGRLNLSSSINEIGSTEVNLIYSVTFFMAAIFGTSNMNMPIVTHVTNLSTVVPHWLHWNQVIAGTYLALLLVFIVESLCKTVLENPSLTLWVMMGPLINQGLAIINSSLNPDCSMGYIILVHQMCQSISGYRIMMCNMTTSKKHNLKFWPIHVEHLVASIPLIVSLACPVHFQSNTLAPVCFIACFMVLFMLFCINIFLLFKQYQSQEKSSVGFWFMSN